MGRNTNVIERNTLTRKLATNFLSDYYTVLEKIPEKLHLFFRDDSMFKWNSKTAVYGVKNIKEFLKQIDFASCFVRVLKMNAMQLTKHSVNINVNGIFAYASGNNRCDRNFKQNFLITGLNQLHTPDNKFYIRSTIFCFDDLKFRKQKPLQVTKEESYTRLKAPKKPASRKTK